MLELDGSLNFRLSFCSVPPLSALFSLRGGFGFVFFAICQSLLSGVVIQMRVGCD